jgi:hypothetical protein
VRLIPGEVWREHGQSAANGSTRELDLERAENTDFSRVGR